MWSLSQLLNSVSNINATIDKMYMNDYSCISEKLYENRWWTRFGLLAIVCGPLFWTLRCLLNNLTSYILNDNGIAN